MTRRLQAAPDIVDVLHGDDGALVMQPNRVQHLSSLGAALLDAAADPINDADLTAHLLEYFGEPPSGDGAEQVRQAIESLLTSGVLVEVD